MNSQIFGVEYITSKANSTVVKISKLMQKKARREEQLFTLDGVKLFVEAHNFGAKIKYIVLKEDAIFEENITKMIFEEKKKGASVLCVNEAVFSKLTEEFSPQGIITVCEFLDTGSDFCFKNDEKIMAFESVRDPGNVGAIIRNAAAFGINTLIFSSDCADVYSQKVIRAAMGAIFKVKMYIVNDFIGTLKALSKNRRIISTTLGENSLKLGTSSINPEDVFVIGNEGHGVSEEVIGLSHETLFIPMCENTESLNASVATAILMWEMYKL